MNESFKKYHRLTLSILRTFGFGDHCMMENRINSEVESLVAELARYQSKPVNPQKTVNSSVVNVIASILFGRHFERSDPDLIELIDHSNRVLQEGVNLILINMFPITKIRAPDAAEHEQLHDAAAVVE
jgi:cytochrome P450 family 2 subfamily K